jgi:TPR repeat protein
LIAGVTEYPNFPRFQQSLKPAAIDLENLKTYLKQQEFFDEIVVLQDANMTVENLRYFLETYFPAQLKASPHSRFLFAYTGHGYAEESNGLETGFLLKNTASGLRDPDNRIDLPGLRRMLNPDITAAEKALVLINSCQSGSFFSGKSFGYNPLAPGERGAHAILASRSNQQSFQLTQVGPGSVFFEKVFAGLSGSADTSPADGVVTYHELYNYLRSQVGQATQGNQVPVDGDLLPSGSIGEFFFLNRNRQVKLQNSPPWNPKGLVAFGADFLETGRAAYEAKDFAHSLEAFTSAAKAGNAEAMMALGTQYEFGLGVPSDIPRARQWYEQSANAGEAEAWTYLGMLYYLGKEVKQDYTEARHCFEKSAAIDPMAVTYLGFIYGMAQGVTQDLNHAHELYEKAAASGYALAMLMMGNNYLNGGGVPQDYGLAREWLEKAALADNDNAMSNLAFLYAEGKGGAQDYVKARFWYEKSANKGNVGSMLGLAELAANGRGEPQNYAKARFWYKKAADAGFTGALDMMRKLPN